MKRDPAAEKNRLSDVRWKQWGPYLSERQWGTVREDYSSNGAAWDYFPHEHARSRAYRWGEDGLAGICDSEQRLCFALALWNERDPILKERLFGLTGNEGNHGEDVKELYYYLDSTPTHSYMKMLYKYPQAEFPYGWLVEENRRRGKTEPEFEIMDTGIFEHDRYFDVFVEYAKAAPSDICIRITVANRGPEAATIHVLPQLWFRNTWSWTLDGVKPTLDGNGGHAIKAQCEGLPPFSLHYEGAPELLFTENETNATRLFGSNGHGRYSKDGVNDCVVDGLREAVRSGRTGTKAAVHEVMRVPAQSAVQRRYRLTDAEPQTPFGDFDRIVDARLAEADEFYAELQQGITCEDTRLVQRQAFAGMLWSKQFYYYDLRAWLEGDPAQPPPPDERRRARNSAWGHVTSEDIISMPDKWEYPWYAAWDLAFHCIPLAMVDASFAKDQLLLLTKEWYMHPNGQLPAYEWNFGDVNPPVHAWASWRVYKIDKKQNGGIGDTAFLEKVLHKLLLNFTWWVNRKDFEGHNIFQGGFLGLDNIGVFDRSSPLPTGGHIEQSDGTAWMGMYCLNLLQITLELAQTNPVYQDLATKFFEHFLYIAEAMVNIGMEGINLWDDADGFYYDVLHLPNDEHTVLRLRSMVGLIPLFAVEVIEPDLLDKLPQFRGHLEWFLKNRPELAQLVSRWVDPGAGERRLLSLLRGHRMKCLLKRMLDETEFLSPYGVRALSRAYAEHPYRFELGGSSIAVQYQPGESDSGLFGGNSNWRGPIWMPVNYLLIESLQKFHHYYGDEFKVECPSGSGQYLSLQQVAEELGRRLSRLFLRDQNGERAVFGTNRKLQLDPHFRDLIHFYEYFHGDTGRGVGASHQTGWTGLIAKILHPRDGTVVGQTSP